MDRYQILDGKRRAGAICRYLANLCGAITFTQEIHNLRHLLDELNTRAREYNIPLFSHDLEARHRELAAQRGQPGGWKRMNTKIPDVRVAAF